MNGLNRWNFGKGSGLRGRLSDPFFFWHPGGANLQKIPLDIPGWFGYIGPVYFRP